MGVLALAALILTPSLIVIAYVEGVRYERRRRERMVPGPHGRWAAR